jgi:hypothetical protein
MKKMVSIMRKLCENLRNQKVYAWFPFGNFNFTRVYGVLKLRPSPIPDGLRNGNLRKPPVYKSLRNVGTADLSNKTAYKLRSRVAVGAACKRTLDATNHKC